MVIRIEEALIYIQPIYLRAEGGKIPELKRVIVAYENGIAMEETLDSALASVFGGRVATEKETAGIVPRVPRVPETGQNVLRQASDHYNRALEAQRRGDWALYGEEIRKLGDLLKSAK